MYRPPRGKPVLALDDVSLEVERARIPGAARTVGLRQVDLALSHRRIPAGRRRPHHDRRQAGRRPGARPRHRVPAFRAVSVEDRARQHPVRPGAAGHAARRAREAGAGFHRSRRPDRLRGQLPVASLRRHEAAHRDRPHARLRSENPADGRAVRRARRADAPPDAGRIARHLAAHAQDRHLRHPRRAGGGLSRRPRRRDVGAAGPHQGDRRYEVRQEATRISSRPSISSTRSTSCGTWCATRPSRRRRTRRRDQRPGPLFAACSCSPSAGSWLRSSGWCRRRRCRHCPRWRSPGSSLVESGELLTAGASSLYRAGAGLAAVDRRRRGARHLHGVVAAAQRAARARWSRCSIRCRNRR